jgi:hypothetical protein
MMTGLTPALLTEEHLSIVDMHHNQSCRSYLAMLCVGTTENHVTAERQMCQDFAKDQLLDSANQVAIRQTDSIDDEAELRSYEMRASVNQL